MRFSTKVPWVAWSATLVFGLGACAPLQGETDPTATPRMVEPGAEDELDVARDAALDTPTTFGVLADVGAGAIPSLVHAQPMSPPANATIAGGGAHSLITATSADVALPLPTTIAAVRGGVVVFGRTRAGYVARFYDAKVSRGKEIGYSPAVVVAPAYEDDAPAVAVGEDSTVWFAVSDRAGATTRIVRLDVPSASVGGAPKPTLIAPREDGASPVPARLGRIVDIVPMKPQIAFIGRDGDVIKLARLARTGGFVDPNARILAQTVPAPADGAFRSPRATLEDDKLLLAWDADSVDGALDAPGTTAADRASPKTGIYVRRFFASGDPASPARRLTKLSLEAHVLDVVVELGACAVLSSTVDGFEMFRFVRKGDDLGPYGGGLHLSGPGGDVSLSTDVIGTLALTPTKLLRIGPGVKIVASPLGFQGPAGAPFDHIHLVSDGGTAYAHLSTSSVGGVLPTIAKVDGEQMGRTIPTPWLGAPPQRLLEASVDGAEALAIVLDNGALQAVRLGLDGEPRGTSPLPFDVTQIDALAWPKSPVPRAALAGGAWSISLSDGRILIATGPKAGTIVPLGLPPGVGAGGVVAIVSGTNAAGTVRAVYIPSGDISAPLVTATFDPAKGTVVDPWAPIAGTDHHYGALGGARYTALPRASGGLYVISTSGPKVTVSAQLYGVITIGPDGAPIGQKLISPAPLQEIALVPTLKGAAFVATLTGRGVAARWLDIETDWRDSFAYLPFRVHGDGPVVREHGTALVLAGPTAPGDLGRDIAALISERCPYVLPAGDRQLLLGCEEAVSADALSTRALVRRVTF